MGEKGESSSRLEGRGAHLVDGENEVLLLGESSELECLGRSRRDRLLDDDMLSGVQAGLQERGQCRLNERCERSA